jgi:hypothetical protein
VLINTTTFSGGVSNAARLGRAMTPLAVLNRLASARYQLRPVDLNRSVVREQ